MEVDKMQTDEAPATTTPAAEPAPALLTPAEKAQVALKAIVALLEKSVKAKDTRVLMGRFLRQTAAVRKQLTPEVLRTFLRSSLPADSVCLAYLSGHVDKVADAMATEESPSTQAVCEGSSAIPEVEMFSYLLVLLYLCDNQHFEQAKELSLKALERLAAFNRRTLDAIAARIYFYYSWCHESTGELAAVRSTLLGLHRTAVLRHDGIGQETLLNLLLRNYLHYNLYDQAEKFRSKAQKSDQFRSQQQFCRYLYYLGRIHTIQLEYTDAKECLAQAVRKAPSSAHGFRIASSKWLVLVRLLLGEVPDRQEFVAPGMAKALRPYLELTQAVRSGNLEAFAQVAQRYDPVFRSDRTHNLITRLHHNVIRTGLRRINLAYSRISLKDVAEKLHLPSVEDAECIVAKAIRDGGIDAVLDHEQGWLTSREQADVYSSAEPQAAFHARIAFCLDLHNEAVKAMRFEPDAHRRLLESSEARKERLAQEQEIAKAIQEDDEDDF